MKRVAQTCLVVLALTAWTPMCGARTISIVRQNVVNDVIQSVDLAFGSAAEGETNRLFAVWGPEAGGEGAEGWAAQAFVLEVPPEMESHRCLMPEGWDATYRAIRFYLVGRAAAYDWRVDYLQSTGAEYVNTGVLHTPDTVLDCMLTLLDPPVGDYNVPFGVRHTAVGKTYPNSLYCFTRYGAKNTPGFARGHQGQEAFAPANVVATGQRVSIHIEGYTSTWTQNGRTIATLTRSETTDADAARGIAPMLLFTLNETATANAVEPNVACNTKMRLHGFRMVSGDTVQCDLIPVVKDGVGYLYDRASGELKGNASGRGAFAVGGPALEGADIVAATEALELVTHRTVSIAATNLVEGVVASVRLAFGPEPVGRTNVLFAAYGPVEGGEGAKGWARCDRVAVVPPEMETLDYPMPSGWGTEHRAIHFFLTAAPERYDAAVAYLESTGQEWINTECLHTPEVLVECEATLLSPTVNAYNTPFGSRVNKSGYHNGLYFFTRYGGVPIAGIGRGMGESRDATQALPMDVPVMTRLSWTDVYWSTNGVMLGRVRGADQTAHDEMKAGAPMFVFTMNEASDYGGENANTACNTRMRLHGFRMFSANGPVCDLQPVVVEGEGALYDRVSGKVLRNGSGAGAFIVGPMCSASERVRSASATLTAATEPFGRALRYRARVDFGNYGGKERLDGFPVLVFLSPETCEGFKYAQCAEDGSDLRFADANGTLLPHEIDTWNTNGTSLVWVRLPALAPEGASVWMGWGRGRRTPPTAPAASEVWRDYVAVWHFGETSGTARDSGPHGFDAVPMGATAAESVGTNVITLGRSRYIPAGCHFEAGGWDRIAAGSALTASGWFRMTGHTTGHSPLLFSNKVKYDDSVGWYFAVQDAPDTVSANSGGATTSKGMIGRSLMYEWQFLAVALGDRTARVYFNLTHDLCLSFQAPSAHLADTFNTLKLFDTQYGDYAGFADEMRIRVGASSADRLAAELKTMADSSFARFGEVEQVYPPGTVLHLR